jgi:hypothetical protein
MKMIQTISLDQYHLDIEYSYEQGDSFHCVDWLDIDVIAGMIEMDEHYDYEMVDMSRDECQDVQDRFGGEIEKRLIEEIGYAG